MKVLIFSRDFLPDFGGVQVWMERLANHHGPDAMVVTRACPGDREFDAKQPYGVRRMPRLDWHSDCPVLRPLLRLVSVFLRFVLSGIYLGEAIRQQKTDVVYCAYPFPNGLPMMVVRILTGCPYVVFVHGSEVLRELEKGGVRLLALRLVLRLAVRVVATGEFMADVVGELTDRNRVVIVPLGADASAFDVDAPPATEAAGVPLAGRKVILTVGRIEKRKGHDMICDALGEITRVQPDALWVAVGDGPERGEIKQRIEKAGLGSHAILAGRVSDNELAGLYARADLFLLPNRQVGYDVEGFGIVFLEAAMFGTPCVAGNSGGAPQAIDDGRTGLLCDGDDPADIAAKVLTILGDDALAASMADAGREWGKKHTWAACAQSIESAVAPLLD